MNELLHLALLLPDGFGIRNFVLTGFLRELALHSDVTVFHAAPAELVKRYDDGIAETVAWRSLEPFQETALSFFQRRTLHYAHMRWANTQSMRHTLRRKLRGSWRAKLLHRAMKEISRPFAFPSGILLLDRWHTSQFRNTQAYAYYTEYFKSSQPSLLFCSNQWTPQTGPAVVAAKDLGITTATFIFSWDNLTSKGRVIVPFDHYLVWSSLMKDELLRFYPDVSEQQVHIVGTPQFDFYADHKQLLPRKEFFNQLGLQPTRPLICYCGGHESTHPDEHLYLGILAALVRQGEICGQPQIVFRPAPTDRLARFEPVLREFPEIKSLEPIWHQPASRGTYAVPVPYPEDMSMLANLLYHSDVNINIASTMTIDSAIFDRPVINPAFDVSSPLPHGKPIWDFYYQFEHYQAVVKLGAARFPRSPQEFARDVNAYLETPELERQGRRALVEYEIDGQIGSGTSRAVDVLSSLVSNSMPIWQ